MFLFGAEQSSSKGIGVAWGRGPGGHLPPDRNSSSDKYVTKKPIVSSVLVSLSGFREQR